MPEPRLQKNTELGFQLLETMRWSPDGGVYLLDRHLARLQASAVYFGFVMDREAIESALDAALNGLSGPAKVRLLVGRDGRADIQVLGVEDTPEPLTAALAAEPVDRTDVFLYHKTTRRAAYERARASRPDADVVLLWNGAGEVTEATIFNLVAQIDGRKVTPPVDCGLLPGTIRAELLESGGIEEQRVTLAHLRDATALWGINSVVGWRRLTFID